MVRRFFLAIIIFVNLSATVFDKHESIALSIYNFNIVIFGDNWIKYKSESTFNECIRVPITKLVALRHDKCASVSHFRGIKQ